MDPAAWRRELDRVRQEIPDDLLQPVGIRRNRLDGLVDVGIELKLPGDQRGAKSLDCRPRGIGWTDRPRFDFQFAADRSRDIQKILYEPRLRLCVAFNRFERAVAGVLRKCARAKHLHPARNRIQRRSELMRQRHREFVLEPTGNFRLFACVTFPFCRGPESVHLLKEQGDEDTDREREA